jgi:hypothetical protein
MGRGPCTFRQRDVARAVKAVVAAGMLVERVEIDSGGKITIVTGQGNCTERNEWDEVLNGPDQTQVR